MRVELETAAAEETAADLAAICLPAGAELPESLREAPGAADVRTNRGSLTLLRPDGRRLLVIGLGDAEGLEPEELRVAAALAAGQARRHDARTLGVAVPELPGLEPGDAAAALVEGALLAELRLDRFKTDDAEEPRPPRLELLSLSVPEPPGEELRARVGLAAVAARAANRARELQHLPANFVDPARLAERAEEIAAGSERLETETLGGEEIAARGMGGLAAVAAGSEREPRLIVLRYRGRDEPGGDLLGLVGKAVTFDSGGLSLKPAAKMDEMKMDMSGGAAVLEAVAAIAELELGLDLVAVVPATENMPSGSAMRPGDVITQLNGKTVEVTNTDAEGRLILADALTYCARELGAARIVDLATLTGGVITALGSTYAGLISNDDELAAAVERAGRASGELAWRLPLHREYKRLTRGSVADLVNSARKRKALTIYAGSFLEEFVEGRPWAHLDIAGTAWDVGREYFGSGPTGFGVRLLVELAGELAEPPS